MAGSGDDLQVTGWTPEHLAELGALSPEALTQRFAVVPATAIARGLDPIIPIAGTFLVDGDVLLFHPRHPFIAGTTYAFLDRKDGRTQPSLLTLPKTARTASTVVAEIHPAVDEVPLNLLRCYIHFSAPMSEGFAAKAVKLYDADSAEPLDGALLDMTPELWDPQRTRLTVLLDPGRIKRGLAPHTEAGYPLMEGRTIRLVVDASFLDATGTPLLASAERRFRVGPASRELVDPRTWEVDRPLPSTIDPLVVRADRPLDHALALRCLTLVDSHGRQVPGAGMLGEGEREWAFTPAEAWAAGTYRLLVAPELEDIAGNSVARVFDRDLADPAHDPRPVETVAVEVVV